MTTNTNNRSTLTSADGTRKLDYIHLNRQPAWSKSTATCQGCESTLGLSDASYGPQHFLSLLKVKYATYSAGEPVPAELTRIGTLVSDYRSLYREDVASSSGDTECLGVVGDEMTLGQVKKGLEALDLNRRREGCWRHVVAEYVDKISASSFT